LGNDFDSTLLIGVVLILVIFSKSVSFMQILHKTQHILGMCYELNHLLELIFGLIIKLDLNTNEN
jgi:hypothetical protein